jgi:hypothetical protein
MNRSRLVLLAVLLPLAAPASASAAPICSKRGAVSAVTDNAFGRQIRASGILQPGERVLGLFTIYRVYCRNLFGSRRREMVVELACCTVSSPDPWAIFSARGNAWRLRFSRVRADVRRLRVGRFRVGGRVRGAVREKLAVLRPTDPNCCPSSYRYRYTYLDNRHFRVVRG